MFRTLLKVSAAAVVIIMFVRACPKTKYRFFYCFRLPQSREWLPEAVAAAR